MSRSKWKGLFLDRAFLKKKKSKKTWFRFWSRRSIISSNLMGRKIFVHNGLTFKPFLITREKIGFKFGEFSSCRQQYGRKVKNK
jgi:ribosomal protein S19